MDVDDRDTMTLRVHGGYTVTVIMEDGRMSTRGEAMKGSERNGTRRGGD